MCVNLSNGIENYNCVGLKAHCMIKMYDSDNINQPVGKYVLNALRWMYHPKWIICMKLGLWEREIEKQWGTMIESRGHDGWGLQKALSSVSKYRLWKATSLLSWSVSVFLTVNVRI